MDDVTLDQVFEVFKKWQAAKERADCSLELFDTGVVVLLNEVGDDEHSFNSAQVAYHFFILDTPAAHPFDAALELLRELRGPIRDNLPSIEIFSDLSGRVQVGYPFARMSFNFNGYDQLKQVLADLISRKAR